MPTLVTPSAKAHERVTGRWVRDIDVQTKKEWLVYYAKLVVGTPIPWLLWAYTCLAFLSRTGLEIAAWAAALLTIAYVLVDRFSRPKEFKFFRIGSDVFLLSYFIVGIVAAVNAPTLEDGLATMGGVRWVLLVYAVAYCYELFPGLNRIFSLVMFSSCAAAIYGIWQHFTGMDVIRNEELPLAPALTHAYFTARSFFSTPEIFGTLLAMTIPFPAAAFLLSDDRSRLLTRWFFLGITLLLAVAVFWTYRPGLWVAAIGALAVTMIMQGKRLFLFLVIVSAALAGLVFLSYDSPAGMFDKVGEVELARASHQRSQINTQVEIWQNNMWIGAGDEALRRPNYDPGSGNVYFQILAQTGILGAGFYLLFLLGFLLSTYRIFYEIPEGHFRHRVLASGALASQLAFHLAGLYWATLSESIVVYVYVLIVAAVAYVNEHYNRGLVPDDLSL